MSFIWKYIILVTAIQYCAASTCPTHCPLEPCTFDSGSCGIVRTRQDRGYIQVDIPYVFGGTPYTDLYVMENALIGFGPITHNQVKVCNYPTSTTDLPFIAVYNFNVDTDCLDIGSVNFRVTKDPEELQRLSVLVECKENTNFEAKSALVATWSNVTIGKCNEFDQHPELNTFQITLVTDGTQTFWYNYYERLESQGGIGYQTADRTESGTDPLSCTSNQQSLIDRSACTPWCPRPSALNETFMDVDSTSTWFTDGASLELSCQNGYSLVTGGSCGQYEFGETQMSLSCSGSEWQNLPAAVLDIGIGCEYSGICASDTDVLACKYRPKRCRSENCEIYVRAEKDQWCVAKFSSGDGLIEMGVQHEAFCKVKNAVGAGGCNACLDDKYCYECTRPLCMPSDSVQERGYPRKGGSYSD